jgi:hypothetical protein
LLDALGKILVNQFRKWLSIFEELLVEHIQLASRVVEVRRCSPPTPNGEDRKPPEPLW